MAMDYFIFSNAEIWICDIPKEGFWFVNMGSSNLNFLWKWNFYNYWSYCTDRYIIDVLSKKNSCKQINVIDITCQITLVLHGMSYQSLHCRKILCIMEENPRLQIPFSIFLLFMVGVFYILALHFHFFIDSFQKKGYMKKCTSINAAFSYHIQ